MPWIKKSDLARIILKAQQYTIPFSFLWLSPVVACSTESNYGQVIPKTNNQLCCVACLTLRHLWQSHHDTIHKY